MDRYDPAQIDRVLVRSSRQILGMACHAIFTFPISLLFDPISGKVTTDYSPCVTLPMITLRGKEAAWGPTVADSEFDADAIKGEGETANVVGEPKSCFAHNVFIRVTQANSSDVGSPG